MAQNIPDWNCLLENIQAVNDLKAEDSQGRALRYRSLRVHLQGSCSVAAPIEIVKISAPKLLH
jgi:hypothetical protein